MKSKNTVQYSLISLPKPRLHATLYSYMLARHKIWRSLLFFPLFLFLLGGSPLFAQVSSDSEYQNPFSDYTPFEDEYDVEEDERFMYFGNYFGVGLGSGVHNFGGNIGRLYNTALPVFNFFLLYFFDFRFAGQLLFNSASHAFNTREFGLTEINLLRLQVDIKYYLNIRNLSAQITSMNPYIIAGVGNTFRTSVFRSLGTTARDSAINISMGGGLEFAVKPRSVSFSTEFRYYQVFFSDRYSSQFSVSGIPDTTGPMYSLTGNIIFFF